MQMQQTVGSPHSAVTPSYSLQQPKRVARVVPGSVFKLLKNGAVEYRERLARGLSCSKGNATISNRIVVQTHIEFIATKNKLNNEREKQASDRALYRRRVDWNEKIQPAYVHYIKSKVDEKPVFCTINTERPMSQSEARKYCENIHRRMQKNVGKDWPMFFAIEKNNNRTGYHIHFVIKRQSSFNRDKVIEFLKAGSYMPLKNRGKVVVDASQSYTGKCVSYILKDEMYQDHDSLFFGFIN